METQASEAGSQQGQLGEGAEAQVTPSVPRHADGAEAAMQVPLLQHFPDPQAPQLSVPPQPSEVVPQLPWAHTAGLHPH